MPDATIHYGEAALQVADLWLPAGPGPHPTVLMVHGGSDSTCPPAWAAASQRAMKAAGVDVRLAWYDGEEHAFDPRFLDAMARTTSFLRAELA